MENFSGKFRVTTLCIDESTGEVVFQHQESTDRRPDFDAIYSQEGDMHDLLFRNSIPQDEYWYNVENYDQYPILHGEDFERAYAEYAEYLGWQPGIYEQPAIADNEERRHRINEYCSLEYGEFMWLNLPTEGLLLPDQDPVDLARAFFIASNSTNGKFSVNDLGLARSKSGALKRLSGSGLFVGPVAPKNFSPDVMWRGKIGMNALKSVRQGSANVRRLYIDQYRSAYSILPVSKHVYLGRLLKLLSYVHKYYGFFCEQEGVNDLSGAKLLTYGDLAELVGMGRNAGPRMREALLGIAYERKGRRWPVIYESEFGGDTAIVLNPKCMYGGNIMKRDDLMVPKMWEIGGT